MAKMLVWDDEGWKGTILRLALIVGPPFAIAAILFFMD